VTKIHAVPTELGIARRERDVRVSFSLLEVDEALAGRRPSQRGLGQIAVAAEVVHGLEAHTAKV
jgi:hypothetical protein